MDEGIYENVTIILVLVPILFVLAILAAHPPRTYSRLNQEDRKRKRFHPSLKRD